MADRIDGGQGGSRGSGDLPNIGDTPDSAVAQDAPGAFADGEPVSPAVAARRYGAAAGQGYKNTNDDPGAP
jgi:hypothetical protein